MTSIGSPSPFFLAGKKAYEVERSLRFNRDDNAYLSRTPSSAGNRKTFTFSAWVKLGQTGINSSTNPGNGLFLSCGAIGTGNNMTYRITNNGYIGVDYYGIGGYYSTVRLRDPSAWYHCVWVMDTTESTAADRFKVYVNGDLIYNNQLGLSQNADTPFNNNSITTIGVYSYSTSHNYRLDAYLAEVHFLDGYAYDPSYFAATDSTTGQWNPKQYTGSYGSNGFYLNFSDNSGTTATTLGKDNSGNGNNWTPNNFSVSAGVGNDSLEDTPTNNWATLNPLHHKATSTTFSNGNLQATIPASANTGRANGNFVVYSGKWYWELKYTGNTGNYLYVGVAGADSTTYYRAVRGSDGELAPNTGTVSVSFTTNDVIMVALDVDNGKWYIGKNGSFMLSGDPVNGTGFVHSGLVTTYNGLTAHFQNATSTGSQTFNINFGQQGFTYTPPTGFKALNSANLPNPTIKLPNKHFDNLTYTGNGSSPRTISGLQFSPDFVWLKHRSGTSWHRLQNSVVGANKLLYSNSTNAEATDESNGHLNSFTSDGFIIDDPNADGLNNNGGTYVGWNWNAGDTDGKTYAVTVVPDSGNKYRFDGFGTSAVTLELAEGGTYIFDQSHSSNAGHPLRFSTTSNGTHGGGTEYTTGVTTAGTPGQSGAYTQIVVAASAPNLYYYCTQHSGMGGQANTYSSLGSSNFDGTIQSKVKVNATAGFSIVLYTGNGTAGATIGHGLGVTPQTFIVKKRSDSGTNWRVYHHRLNGGSNPENYGLVLNGTFAELDRDDFNDTAPTSTSFTVGTHTSTNNNGHTYVAYCFSEVAGYSKFGSYSGNGSSNGTFVFTGFRPAWIMTKRNNGGSQNWLIHDIKRDPHNVANKKLAPNLSNEENNTSNIGSSSQDIIDILSNGFKMRSNNNHTNISGGTFIYLAFAESPFKNARAR